MASVLDSFSAGSLPVSFEMFPPKGELTLQEARDVAAQLAPLEPSFISVTYSAGGSGNSGATADIAALVQREFGVPSVAHLTCMNAERATIDAEMDRLRALGVENVLALRGDRVEGAQARDFRYAKELIPLLADRGFVVGAAAYPEGHIECLDERRGIEHLKEKQDAGAAYLVTQLFFDNQVAYRFLERARAAHIAVPITFGVMPFLSKSQITRMVFTCGASLPAPIIKLLAKYEDSPADLRRAGIEYACGQLADLARHGVDGVHVYAMNHADIAQQAVAAVRAVR